MFLFSIAKNRFFFTIIALLIHGFSYSQNPRYWIQSAGGHNADEGYGIAVDRNNNYYTTGYFTDTAEFVNTNMDSITLMSKGFWDIFICKNDSAGKYLWAIKAGGKYLDCANAIQVDKHGSIYVTGFFTDSAEFSGIQVNANGLKDMFVAKYNTDGILQWVRTGGSSHNDAGNAIAVDNNGNVIVTGEFTDTATFGPFSLISQIDSVTLLSSIDVFTLKYDSSGTILWAKKGSSQYTDRGLGVGCDAAGNIYVTGQFSDTVVFDTIHYSSLYNAIFLIKYDGNGNEKWFTKAGGGATNVAYGLVVNDSANIFLTGDCRNHLLFFGPPITNLTTPFHDGVFVAKFDSSGHLSWASSSGSDNYISSRSIAIDDSSNAFITGNFDCVFSEYSNHYGRGCFNSIGGSDIFVSKFNASGQWQWARNYGSQWNDNARGICVNSFHQPVITGSFDLDIDIPYLNSDFNFTNGTPLVPVSDVHHSNCLDSANYNREKKSEGIIDIFILNVCDPEIAPYYYYDTNYDTACVRPVLTADFNGLDTIISCGNVHIPAPQSHTGGLYYGNGSAGPNYFYNWSNGAASPGIIVTSTGTYTVTISSQDGCFSSSASIYAIVNPFPQKPKITDSKGINIYTDSTSIIHVCAPDSFFITVNNAGNDSIHWTGNGSSHDSVFYFNTHNLVGDYFISAQFIDSNGCVGDTTSIHVIVDTALSPLIPKLSGGANDTFTVCSGSQIYFFTYDSLSDPNGLNTCNPAYHYATVNWSFSPVLSFNYLACTAHTQIGASPVSTGSYHLTCIIRRNSFCGGLDSFNLSKDFYVIVNPLPHDSISILTNPFLLCPGDSGTLVASLASNYAWTSSPGGLIHGNSHQSSVEIFGPGHYVVTIRDTNSFGCTTHASANIVINSPPVPVISMNPADGLICPGDSVQFTTSNIGTYHWFGPNGAFGANDSIAYGTVPGHYYCIVDSGGCSGHSNVFTISNYSTPYLLVTPFNVICPGNYVNINVITNQGSIIQWQPPLSGSGLSQHLNTPGQYSCDITSCGIVTHASETLIGSNISVSIDSSGPLTFCPGDFVTLFATPGMPTYQWSPDGSTDPVLAVYQSGFYYVIVSDGYCTATSQIVSVNVVNSIPVPVLTAGSPLCSGDSVNILSNADTTLNFLWTGPNGFYSNDFSPVIHHLIADDGGTYMLTLTQSQTSCTNSATIDISIDSLPPVAISSSVFSCINSADTLTSTWIPGVSYSWSTPGGNIDTTNDIYFPSIQYSDSGIYHLTVTDGICYIHQNYDLTVINSVPVPAIFSNSPLCAGDSLRFSATSLAGINYQWSGPNNFSSNLNVPVIPDASTPDSGIYLLTVGHGSCTNHASVHIVIDSIPPVSISSRGITCVNASDTITATFIPGAVYSWSSPGGNNYSTNEIDLHTVQYSDTGIYHLVVTKGVCTYNSLYDFSGILGIPNSVLTSNSPLCSGDTLILAANSSPGINYQWSGPGGFSSNNNSPVIPNINTTDSGIYSVTISQSVCITSATIQISIDSLPEVPVTANEKMCLHSAGTIVALNIPNANYSWTSPSGTNYSTASITIPSLQYSDTGIYQLTVSKGHCIKNLDWDLNVHDCSIHIPNVFTPNRDGLNDYFKIDSVVIESINCKIFNRWGKLIYTWDTPDGNWDGTDQNTGKMVSDGVYYYVMDLKLPGEEPLIFHGTVELLSNAN